MFVNRLAKDDGIRGRFLEVNDVACARLGYRRSELLQLSPKDIVPPEMVIEAEAVMDRLRASGQVLFEQTHVTKEGDRVPVETNAHVFQFRGQPAVLAIARDITDRKQAEEAVRHMAYHDGLTGLPNRSLLNDRLDKALTHAQRNGRELALMILDLDRFKSVNDTLGHAVGDRLLQAVADRLGNLLRSEDTVARLGGDEFAILLPEICHAEDAAQVARKILRDVRKPFTLGHRQLHVTASVGIAVHPRDSDEPETLMRKADMALYRAKERGRDNYQDATPAA